MRVLIALASAVLVAGCGGSSGTRSSDEPANPPPDSTQRPGNDVDAALADMEAATTKPPPPTSQPGQPPIQPVAMPEQVDKPLFEERWAESISRVRMELQKYKRW